MRVLLIVAILLGPATLAPAQQRPDFPYKAYVTAKDVYVRSGPSTNYYPVAKLNAGVRVTVVGEESGWLAIVPPPDCHSVIDATYVDRDRDKRGVVNGNRVNVRAGSNGVTAKL